MPNVGSGLAGGGGLALLSTALLNSAPPPPPPVLRPATKDDLLFDTWPSEDEATWSGEEEPTPECDWFNGSVIYTSPVCSHFALSRLASSATSLAIERATRCATAFDVDCVLSAEVGLSVPALFVYDHETVSMRMLLAPSILAVGGDQVRVRVNAQDASSAAFYQRFNTTLDVAYMPGGRRAPVTETLNGSDAFCVQLLRSAYDRSCWEQLD